VKWIVAVLAAAILLLAVAVGALAIQISHTHNGNDDTGPIYRSDCREELYPGDPGSCNHAPGL